MYNVQEAEAYNQRNIAEEGGGGYVAFVWDCAYWGTQVKLAQFTGTASYATEVRQHLPTLSICDRRGQPIGLLAGFKAQPYARPLFEKAPPVVHKQESALDAHC